MSADLGDGDNYFVANWTLAQLKAERNRRLRSSKVELPTKSL